LLVKRNFDIIIIIIIIILWSMSSGLLKFGVTSKIVNNEDIHISVTQRALILVQSLLIEEFLRRITKFVFSRIVCYTSWTLQTLWSFYRPVTLQFIFKWIL